MNMPLDVAGIPPIMFPLCWDNSPFNETSTLGVITCFCGGDCSVTLMRLPESKREAAMTAWLVKSFGPRASKPLRYVDYNWMNDEYVGGAFTVAAAPGQVSQLSALNEDFGRIMGWRRLPTSRFP